MDSDHPQRMSAQSFRPSRYIVASGIALLVVALAVLSVSIRIHQVSRVIHGLTQSSSMPTKTELPTPIAVDFELVALSRFFVTPRPRRVITTRMRTMDVPLPSAQVPWYSVSVQHRPPPFCTPLV